MRRACLLCVCLVPLLGCRGGEDPGALRQEPLPAEPILAVDGGKLLELDSLTLRPVPGRSAAVGEATGSAAISPDGTRVAVGRRSSLRIVELVSLRVVKDVPKPRGHAALVSWAPSGRILVVNEVPAQQRVEALVFDVVSGRLLVRRRVPGREGWPFGIREARGSAVFLLHPIVGIGPVRLVAVDAGGRVRVVRLHRIRAGSEWVDGMDVVRDVWPALAVDEARGRAFVVAAGDMVAEVDLRTFGVSYHSFEEPTSLLGRMRSWLDPVAEAKASDWVQLGALWLGQGRIAVFGIRSVPFIQDEVLQERDQPLGLRFVDTEDWSVRVVDEQAGWCELSDGVLLAYASLWDSIDQRRHGIGLRAYSLQGTRRFHVLGEEPIAEVQPLRDRAIALLDDAGSVALVDLRTGEILRRLPRGEAGTGIPELVLRAG